MKSVILAEQPREKDHASLRESWERIKDYVQKKTAAGQTTWQELETCIWVEVGGKPVYFYELRDMAAVSGW